MKKSFESVLFTDIETVMVADHFASLGARDQELFEKKVKQQLVEKAEKHTGNKADALEELWQDNASFHAEFSKICCIGFGYISGDELRIKSVASRDEREILLQLQKITGTNNFTKICGHNIVEFDIPFMCRRMIMSGLQIPSLLYQFGRKTWDNPVIDTMDMWGFGAWKHRVSLDLLCHALGVPSPKGVMDGSKVKEYYYNTPTDGALPFEGEEERMKAIGDYCAGDIVALANAFLRLNGEELIHKVKYV